MGKPCKLVFYFIQIGHLPFYFLPDIVRNFKNTPIGVLTIVRSYCKIANIYLSRSFYKTKLQMTKN